MPGVANPVRIVKAFGALQAPPYITPAIPVAPGVTPGAASYDYGFPALNMTDPAAGGVPPSGADMNGILMAISSFCAMLQAGQLAQFDATAATAFGGYKIGAMLASTTPGLFWFNTVDGNTDNPDDGTPVGWIGWRPTGGNYLAATASAGTTNNAAPTGFNAGTLTLDVDPSAGDATWTGLAAGTEGQRVVITNVGSTYGLTLAALNGGSDPANQFRAVADFSILPGTTLQVQYSVGAGKWIVIP